MSAPAPVFVRLNKPEVEHAQGWPEQPLEPTAIGYTQMGSVYIEFGPNMALLLTPDEAREIGWWLVELAGTAEKMARH